MKKLKEFLIFAVLFVVFTVARFPWYNFMQKSVFIIDAESYKIQLFEDKLYWEAYFSSFFLTFGVALAIVAIFVGILFLLKNKYRMRRAVFYILCIASGVPAAAICSDKTIALIGHPTPNYAGHTLVMKTEEIMAQALANSLVQNALLALQMGFLCALFVWLAEIIASKIKSKKEKINEEA